MAIFNQDDIINMWPQISEQRMVGAWVCLGVHGKKTGGNE